MPRTAPSPWHESVRQRWWRWVGLALVAGAHIAAAWKLHEMDRTHLTVEKNAVPIEVSFVAGPEPDSANPNNPPQSLPVSQVRPRPAPVALPTPTASVPADESDPPARLSTETTPMQVEQATVTAAVYDADYLHNPPPAYPALARRLGDEGKVMVKVYVSAEGIAEQVEIQASSGSALLDQAALNAVRCWKFVAAKRGDKSIATWAVVPLHFKLGD